MSTNEHPKAAPVRIACLECRAGVYVNLEAKRPHCGRCGSPMPDSLLSLRTALVLVNRPRAA